MAQEIPAEEPAPSVHIDVISDVVCPWCYIGKHRLEAALAQTPDVTVGINWRPYFLNPWIPREGIDRQTYLETKFGSVERYAAIAERVGAAAQARAERHQSQVAGAHATGSAGPAASAPATHHLVKPRLVVRRHA